MTRLGTSRLTWPPAAHDDWVIPDQIVQPQRTPKTAIVLSGGGMRGAYEVGVVLGIVEVLGRKPSDPAMFQILSGTSVGAINAAFYAANSHYGDHGAGALRDVWNALSLKDHAHLRPLGLLRPPRALRRFRDWFIDGRGSSLLDTSALEDVVRRSVDWQKLHSNIDSGVISALLIAALHVVSGRTTVFAELSREADYAPSRDQRRAVRYVQIEADHVLASAAIPLLFPTRRVGDQYYSDGGLRFNTPIAPAIRAGAERIVVISVMRERSTSEADLVESMAPPGRGRDLSPIFLVGKLLNALLLDPVLYDLQVLERFNQLMSVLEQALPPEQMQRVQNVLAGNRGIGYRRLRTLVFTPSQDLGKLAGRYLRTSLKLTDLNPFVKYALQRVASDDPAQEADWASYLLFDGGFAAELIEIGRSDAHAKAAEIKSFFLE